MTMMVTLGDIRRLRWNSHLQAELHCARVATSCSLTRLASTSISGTGSLTGRKLLAVVCDRIRRVLQRFRLYPGLTR
jgi:hypothetical protein